MLTWKYLCYYFCLSRCRRRDISNWLLPCLIPQNWKSSVSISSSQIQHRHKDAIHVCMHALLVWSINSTLGNIPTFVIPFFCCCFFFFLVKRNASEALFTCGFVLPNLVFAVKQVYRWSELRWSEEGGKTGGMMSEFPRITTEKYLVKCLFWSWVNKSLRRIYIYLYGSWRTSSAPRHKTVSQVTFKTSVFTVGLACHVNLLTL